MIDVACPVCGNSIYHVLYRPWRDVNDPKRLFGAVSGERGTQQIVRCATPGCGMVYVSPRHDDAFIVEGYRQASDGGHDTQYESRVRTFLLSLQKHAAVLPPAGSTVLDVGCAGGAFLDAARQFGYQPTGLELSTELVAKARERGLQVIQGGLDAAPAGSRYDLVTLWDVLEHVTDPNRVLDQATAHLKDNGTLLINYPDVGTLQAKLAGKRFWWFLSVHLYHFDRSTIAQILKRHGFQVMSLRRHVQRLQTGYLLDMAQMYQPTLSRLFKKCIPSGLWGTEVPYYASQTTAIARRKTA